MLKFKKIQLEDLKYIEEFVDSSDARICDITLGGIFMWRDYFNSEYVIYDDILFFKMDYFNNQEAFCIPLVKDNCKTKIMVGITLIKHYCLNNNIPLVLATVTKKDLSWLQDNYDITNINKERDWFDYYYESQKLIELKGKQYSTQRNHVNTFIKLYKNTYIEKIDHNNIVSLIEHYKKYYSVTYDNPIKNEENIKVLELLENYFVFKQVGIILYLDHNIIGFAIGEIRNDILFDHVERSLKQYSGIGTYLSNCFVKEFKSKYVNREEDVGDLGLRYSKSKLRPIEIIEKYTVIIN